MGNGELCQRRTQNGVEQLPCPSPELCPIGQNGNCKVFGRLYANLDDVDELGSFIFRTTGYNSIRTLMARLSYFNAVSGGLLSCLPLQLTIRGKSTTQSYRTPIYYVDLTLQDNVSLKDAVENAQAIHALVPLSEMFGYATELRSATQGRGVFTMEFDHYAPVSSAVAEKIINR